MVPAPGMDLAEALNTEAAILLSRTVMEAAVDELLPHEQASRPSRVADAVAATRAWLEGAGLVYASDPRERWIELLQKQVKVKPSIDASVLQISYSDADPQRAAALLNSVMRHYIEHHVKVFSVPGSAELLRERVDSVDAELRARRAQLAAFKKRASVVAPDETRAELVKQSSALGVRIDAARAELETLLMRLGSGHPEVTAAQSRLRRLEQTRAQDDQKLSRMELEQARIESMQPRINSLEAEYRDYAKRYDDARLADQASATAINVSIVDRAAIPQRPQYSRLVLLLAAAAGALALSLLIAFVREALDRRLAEPAAAQDILGVPELGSVPRLPRRRLRAALRRASTVGPSQ
jgi:uncharacterized protein involved in exopolysaccharide biosynthesis